MGISIGKIAGAVASIIPGGDIAKSALGLILKKAAKTAGIDDQKTEEIMKKANEIAEQDIELKKMLIAEREQERQFILEEEGRFLDKPPIAKLLSSIARPVIGLATFALLFIQILVRTIQFIFHVAVPLPISPELIEINKWVIAFYFVLRTGEKGWNEYTKRKNGNNNGN